MHDRHLTLNPIVAGFCLFFCAAAVHAASPPVQSPPESAPQEVRSVLASKPGDTFVVLKNGLTLLVREKRDSDVVSSQVFVRAGSIYEGQYLTAGLSHYLEHVVSGGTTRSFKESEAKERLQRIGGISNAYTSMDRTVYYINTTGPNWKEALDLLLSYVSETTLDPSEVEREKAVIQQEFKMGENSIDRELWKLFLKTAYQTSPVQNPVIGYEEVFVQQNREALLDYYTRRYQPENMVVAVVGNVSGREVIDFAASKTKDFSRRADPPTPIPDEPPQTSRRSVEQRLPLARLNQVMIGFPSVTLQSRDMHALDVLSFLLGEGRTSRLYWRLKENEGLVLGIGSSNWTPSFVHGQFTISLTLSPENWPKVVETVESEIDRFKTQLVEPQELEKAKKASIAQHVFGKETAASIAASLASSYFDTGDPYFDEAYLERIRKVTPEEVRAVARDYLKTDRMTIATIRPMTGAEATRTDTSPETASRQEPVTATHLDNGLQVLVKQDKSLPFVTLQLYGLGGLLLENAAQPGIASFATSLLTAGTKTRSKQEILRAIEDVGGSLSARSDNSTFHVSIKVLKEDLDLGLAILADVVQNAQFPPEEIEKKRKETLLAIQKQNESWQFEIMQLFKSSYFKSSPYKHDRLGTVDSVSAFKRDDILSFYRSMVNPQRCVLAVFGDLGPEAVTAGIKTAFGSWKGERAALPELPRESHPLAADASVEKKNEKSSAALFIGTNGLDLHDARRPVLDVLDAVLAGASYPGGRLFEALRGGQEDLVYVVGAVPFYGRNAGYFGIVTQTTMGNLPKVETIVLDHLKRVRTEPIPENELTTAKDMLLIGHEMQKESLDSQAQDAAVNEVLGLGWDYESRYPAMVRAVTAEQVQALARELFQHTLTARTLPEKPVEVLHVPRETRHMHLNP
ncbi:MAG: M16 family metallopeptidase [Syntrophobacteraceae bacterium]